MASKKSLASMNKNICKAKFSFLSPIPPACYHDSAGRIVGDLWWMNKEFCSVNIIIPPWFSMPIYHKRDEQ
jgi:hypothetical protein